MAINTNTSLRNEVIYQVFIRNFSPTHDIQGTINKLDYIKDLGTDIIHLLPIHPIGELNRKGTLGSPYSIKDYYQINPEYGTLEDFKQLIKQSHDRNIKVIIDIVFNHTSHDATYTIEHPNWYYRKKDGTLTNRVGDWWDIADFDFTNNDELKQELINVLLYWTKLGVDGFRCDVAPLIPLDLWIKARGELLKVNPDIFMLSESVHPGFIIYIRDLGYDACSDSEMYQAFDACYDYDIYEDMRAYLLGKAPLSNWIDGLKRQEYIYPKNYIKARNLENHDQNRIAKLAKNELQLKNLTALVYFLKGITLIYNGQECMYDHQTSLFDLDEVDFSNQDNPIKQLMIKMANFKHQMKVADWIYNIEKLPHDIVKITYQKDKKLITGLFNLSGEEQPLKIKVKGTNYLTNEIVTNPTTLSEPLIIVK